MKTVDKKILHLNGAREALTALCDGFFDDLAWIDACTEASAKDIPRGVHDLLVHHNHMTATLVEHYGQPVALDVVDQRQSGDQYRRKIVLTVDAGRVVEFGIVRLDLRFTSPPARAAILERKTPLGDIFGQYQVLTRVEPLWYLQFPPESPPVQYFRPPSLGPAYGRIAMIHCDGQPALELLEVVRGDGD